MIKVENLHKSFGEEEILHDINFEFKPGVVNVIIGGSGSGKTVLTKCIVGLFELTKGQVLYEGVNFHALNFEDKKEIRKQIGFLFQGGALFDSMTVEENVMFPLNIFEQGTKKERIERVHFVLDRVNLNGAEKKYPAEISGGMQKRVAIARAIAMKPKYLFCDEPNSGLDPKTAIVIDNLIGEITKEYNMTTIVITHDMNSVLEIGENIMFIYKGRLEWTGNRNEILTTPNTNLSNCVYASDFMKKIRSIANS